MIGIINLQFENIKPDDLERIRKNIHTQFTEGVFFIKNGSATLHFNPKGIIQKTEFKFQKYPELFPLDKTFLLTTINQTHSESV
jgi:hypothetical protein